MALSTIKTASITDDAVTAPKVSDGVFNAHRNLIINGAMQVAQRSTSTASVTSGAYHACDRWNIFGSSFGTYTVSQSSTSPDGFANSLKLIALSQTQALLLGTTLVFNKSLKDKTYNN